MGRRAITPLVGLRPASPHRAAGMRTEPPPSVAVAMGARPAASAAPDPPLEPPGDHWSPHGLRVTPKTRFAEYPSVANSGRFVLPTTIAPAARSRAGVSPSRVAGGPSANSAEPWVVRRPVTSSRSFTRTG